MILDTKSASERGRFSGIYQLLDDSRGSISFISSFFPIFLLPFLSLTYLMAFAVRSHDCRHWG